MQPLEPLAVHDISVSARNVLHVTRVDEHHVDAPCLEDLVETGGEPVGQTPASASDDAEGISWDAPPDWVMDEASGDREAANRHSP